MRDFMSSRFKRLRLMVWGVLTSIFFIGFIGLCIRGLPLNTNLMDLLPESSLAKTEAHSVAQQATAQFSKTMGEQLIFLVGNPDLLTAQRATVEFSQALVDSQLFKKITYQVNATTQQAWGEFYFQHRLSLLTPTQKALLKTHDIAAIEQKALFNLYSPIGVTSSALLENDPFALFQDFITSIPNPATHLQIHEQYMMINHNGIWYALINAEIQGDSFSLNHQDKLLNVIQQAEKKIQLIYAKTDFIQTGMLFYAHAGALQAKQEVSTIGIGSIVGVILLLLFTFRSLSPLFYTLLSSLVGFVAGFVVTYCVFGSVYLFTLVFGASLIGVAVDYAFFYYAEQFFGGPSWQANEGLQRIFPGITLGLLNVILAFVIIAFAPFPGLRQLAVFAITGLLMAYATVICAFPYLLKPKIQSHASFISKFASSYLSLWKVLSKRTIVIIYIAIVLFSLGGISLLKVNDDIHALESIPASLKQAEQQVKAIIGSDTGTNFIVVQGETAEAALNHTQAVTRSIKQAFPSIAQAYISMADYLPTVADQEENYQLITSQLLGENLNRYLTKIDVSQVKITSIQKRLSSIPFKALTVQDWLHSPVSDSLRFLWLGQINQQSVTVILLSTKINDKAIQNLVKQFPFATYVNKADDISNIFKKYRQVIAWLLITAFGALF